MSKKRKNKKRSSANTAGQPADNTATKQLPVHQADAPEADHTAPDKTDPDKTDPDKTAPDKTDPDKTKQSNVDPVKSKRRTTLVDVWPHLALREATIFVFVLAVVLGLGLLQNAPLGPVASPTEPNNPEKAPWYFVGVQEMVSYSAPTGVILFPLIVAVGLLLLPLLDRKGSRSGKWFTSTGPATFLFAVVLGLASSVLGLWLWESGITRSSFLNPALLAFAAACAGAVAAWFRKRSTHALGIALVCSVVASYLVFTLVGELCRGPSWVFYWPWQDWPAQIGQWPLPLDEPPPARVVP